MTDLIKSPLRFGPFTVDLAMRELRKSGIRVRLSGQPFEILAALLEHPGQLVTRDQLRKRIWSDDTFVDFGHGLNAAVNKLREALCDSADEPRFIETLPRRGYRFMAAVEESTPVSPVAISTSPEPPLQPVAAPIWREPGNDDWQSTIPVRRQTLVLLSSVLAGILLISFGITGVWSHWPSHDSPRDAETRLKRAAGPSAYQATQRALKETAESSARSASGNLELQPNVEPSTIPASSSASAGLHSETPNSGNKSNLRPDAWDEDSLLRLERSGRVPRFFRAQSSVDNPAILRLDLTKGPNFNSVEPVVVGREAIAGPQPSPDGSKLVFMAGRTDAMDIWVCNSDGSSPRKLTDTGRAGTPRWSPDSHWIVFDSDGRFGRSGIYVVSADGGMVRAVVEDQANNSVPSWSRDGRFIYFASNQGADWGREDNEIWKVPAAGGQPVQITRHGGFSAFESTDGQTLYYAKSRYENPEIWRVPVNGGTESRVSLLHPSTWASWTLTNKGILLLSEYSGQISELQYFDFATRSIHSLAELEKASFWLSSSANGSSIWYSELTDNQARQVFKAGLD
ncbi:MAG: winged helix-turn-helix domain-containing protein [Candidatus Acidiferrum sp.]|jgi:DNA-binding winged helix-turn-helix (wHTH) protein